MVRKADKTVRICGDYKATINQAVEDEQYPLPTTQDLYAALAGSKVFSKLDLSHAYAQLEVDEESHKFLTINTHKGLYSYRALPYGVKSAVSSHVRRFPCPPVMSAPRLSTRAGHAHHLPLIGHGRAGSGC